MKIQWQKGPNQRFANINIKQTGTGRLTGRRSTIHRKHKHQHTHELTFMTTNKEWINRG